MLSGELSEMFRPNKGHQRGPQRGKKSRFGKLKIIDPFSLDISLYLQP